MAKAEAKKKKKSTPVFLDDSQVAWLRAQPSGISGTVRALVFEAMNLENLAKSVKKRRLRNPKSKIKNQK